MCFEDGETGSEKIQLNPDYSELGSLYYKYTTGRNEIQRCVFRFRTFNLNPSWILSQLSYERVLYIKSFVYASLFDCKNKIGKICTVRETINRTTRQGSNRPLACCPVYSFSNCTDFSKDLAHIFFRIAKASKINRVILKASKWLQNGFRGLL